MKRLNLKLLLGVLLAISGLVIVMMISGSASSSVPQIILASALFIAGVVVQLWAGKKRR